MKKTSAVPALLRAGLSPTEIATPLRISRCAVYKIKHNLEQTGTAQRKPGSGHPRSVRTKHMKEGETMNQVKSCQIHQKNSF